MKVPKWLQKRILMRIAKEVKLADFLKKFFSTDSIVSRVIRALMLAGSFISGMGHFPATANEWTAVIGIFLGGLVNAGQNNAPPAVPASEKPTAVAPTA